MSKVGISKWLETWIQFSLQWIGQGDLPKAKGKKKKPPQKITVVRLLNLQFPWLDHMQAIFEGANVSEADVVLTTSPSYLRKVTKLLKQTSKE